MSKYKINFSTKVGPKYDQDGSLLPSGQARIDLIPIQILLNIRL